MRVRHSVLKLLLAGLFCFVLVILFAMFAAPKYGSSNKPVNLDTKTKLYLNWIYTASFAGDVVAADKTDERFGLEIDLVVGGDGRDPIKLVRDNEFGVASADEILRAREKGADVVIIGLVQQSHPAAFATLDSSNIKSVKDFEGKRVGLLPFGATGLIYEAMISRSDADRSKITEVVVSPDLRPFIAGRTHDVHPVFMYDEPVTLAKENITFGIIDPRDYGVNFKGQSYFTTSRTVYDNPELVIKFLKSAITGWGYALDDPKGAIEMLHKRSNVVSQIDETKRLQIASSFIRPNDATIILMTEQGSWKDMINILDQANLLDQEELNDGYLNISLLQQAYKELGE